MPGLNEKQHEKMEVLQARDWKQCIDERQEIEQTNHRSYQRMLANIRSV